jgi:hypothetical protein
MNNVSPSPYPETALLNISKYTTKKVDGFSGLQVRNCAYGTISRNEISDGTVMLRCDKNMATEDFLTVVEWISYHGAELLKLSL